MDPWKVSSAKLPAEFEFLKDMPTIGFLLPKYILDEHEDLPPHEILIVCAFGVACFVNNLILEESRRIYGLYSTMEKYGKASMWLCTQKLANSPAHIPNYIYYELPEKDLCAIIDQAKKFIRLFTPMKSRAFRTHSGTVLLEESLLLDFFMLPFVLSRHQACFSFAMTINKSQGQTRKIKIMMSTQSQILIKARNSRRIWM
jgi:hypothetical protein